MGHRGSPLRTSLCSSYSPLSALCLAAVQASRMSWSFLLSHLGSLFPAHSGTPSPSHARATSPPDQAVLGSSSVLSPPGSCTWLAAGEVPLAFAVASFFPSPALPFPPLLAAPECTAGVDSGSVPGPASPPSGDRLAGSEDARVAGW